jgi:hypothetical protein
MLTNQVNNVILLNGRRINMLKQIRVSVPSKNILDEKIKSRIKELGKTIDSVVNELVEKTGRTKSYVSNSFRDYRERRLCSDDILFHEECVPLLYNILDVQDSDIEKWTEEDMRSFDLYLDPQINIDSLFKEKPEEIKTLAQFFIWISYQKHHQEYKTRLNLVK